jgi:hypothetical protein
MLARCRALVDAGDYATHPEITAQLCCPVCTGSMLVVERMTKQVLQ